MDDKKKPTLEFCAIDATDMNGPIFTDRIAAQEADSANNLMVVHEATNEYLLRLLALQEEIRAKYEPRLDTKRTASLKVQEWHADWMPDTEELRKAHDLYTG